MTTNDDAPGDIFLTTEEIFARYRCGRTKGYELLKAPGFPPRIGRGYSLAAIIAWERSQLDTVDKPAAVDSRCPTCSAPPSHAPASATTPAATPGQPATELGPPRTRRTTRSQAAR